MDPRHPAVAGRFYPGTAAEIRRALGALFPSPPPDAVDAKMILCPHAGWIYSGAICAETVARVNVPRTCLLLGPNHTGMGAPVSLWSGGPWRIPGAEIPVDADLARRLVATGGFAPDRAAHRYEHCLEVIVPMLWARNPEVHIVPVVLGGLALADCLELGSRIAGVLSRRDDPVLVVVSSDMSHYVPAEIARRKDALALAHVEAVDPQGLYTTVVEHDISMCGFIPATVGLATARALGATRGTIVRYGNSGEASGDFDRVVGYAGAIVC
ncbi:MAG: AmmeMemoRadiSam system protein B [Deltaproteobacteria bacterium]|nr:MAG: AmmeMemoRadiSam system protein B [Deltaproteobacteria bacterium]